MKLCKNFDQVLANKLANIVPQKIQTKFINWLYIREYLSRI